MIKLVKNKNMSKEVLGVMSRSLLSDNEDIMQALHGRADILFESGGGFVLTSGQVENTALMLNTAFTERGAPCKVVCSVLDDFSTLTTLMPPGMSFNLLGVDSDGRLIEEQFDEALEHKPSLVILTVANAETGVMTDIRKYAAKAKEVGALVYVDASHAAGLVDLRNVPNTVDYIGLSSIQLGGPEAVGLIWAFTGIEPASLYIKYNETRDMNMLGAAGFAAAIEESSSLLEARVAKLTEYRDLLDQRLSTLKGVSVNCWNTERVANISNYNFEGVDARVLCLILRKMGILVMYTCESFEGTTGASPLMHNLHKGDAVNSNLRIQLPLDIEYAEVEETYNCIAKAYTELRKCTRVQKGYTHVK